MVKTVKILILLTAITLVGYYLFKNTRDFNTTLRTEEKLDLSSTNNKQTIEVNGKEYAYAWVQISNSESLFLFPNFKEKYTLDEGVDNYDCKNLTSGGFYTETNSPIGLFISEEVKFNNKISSNLFNGYFILTKENKPIISRDYSGVSVRIGLQTGPLLIQNGVIQKLALTGDKMARRIVVALTKEDEIYFITLYDKDSVFIGPLLADLPVLVSKIQDEIKVEFISALNLDGGAASAFYTQSIQLSELTPIGSFFCEK